MMFKDDRGGPSERRRGLAAGIVVAATLSGYIAVSTANLSHPGLQYDETIFVSAALGGHDGTFIHSAFLGVPLMLMSYVGALKSYLFAPVFGIFGVSVTTIRLPSILLSAVALSVSYLLARRFLGRIPAIILLALLASDPALIVMSRADWGPVVLMTLLKMSSLLLLVAFLQSKQLIYLVLMLGTISLGLFDKLNFLWFIGAVAVATPLAFWPDLRDAVAEHRSRVLLLTSGAAALNGLYLANTLPAAVHDTTGASVALTAHFWRVWKLYVGTFDGSGLYQYIVSRALPSPGLSPFLLGLAVTLGALSAARLLRHSPHPEMLRQFRAGIFFLLMFAFTFAAMVVTRQADGPQHVFMLWAYPAFATICFMGALSAARYPWRTPKLLVWGSTAALAIVLSSQLIVDHEFVDAFAQRGPYDVKWTPSIYRLSNFLECRADAVDSIMLADWGMANQLTALAKPQNRVKYQDLWATFVATTSSPSTTLASTASSLFTGRRVLVVTHVGSLEVFRGTRAALFRLAQAGQAEVLEVGVIAADDHQQIFDVYSVSGAGQGAASARLSVPSCHPSLG